MRHLVRVGASFQIRSQSGKQKGRPEETEHPFCIGLGGFGLRSPTSCRLPATRLGPWSPRLGVDFPRLSPSFFYYLHHNSLWDSCHLEFPWFSGCFRDFCSQICSQFDGYTAPPIVRLRGTSIAWMVSLASFVGRKILVPNMISNTFINRHTDLLPDGSGNAKFHKFDPKPCQPPIPCSAHGSFSIRVYRSQYRAHEADRAVQAGRPSIGSTFLPGPEGSSCTGNESEA